MMMTGKYWHSRRRLGEVCGGWVTTSQPALTLPLHDEDHHYGDEDEDDGDHHYDEEDEDEDDEDEVEDDEDEAQ